MEDVVEPEFLHIPEQESVAESYEAKEIEIPIHSYAPIEAPYTPVSMDIRPVRHFSEEQYESPQAAPVAPRIRRKARRRSSSLVARAIFIGFVVLISAVAAIGSGLLDSKANLAGSGIIQFIGGVENVDKH